VAAAGVIKAELFTDEQAGAMYAAGFRWILVGFESGSSRILENINNKATRAENTRYVEIAQRHGLKVKALCHWVIPASRRRPRLRRGAGSSKSAPPIST
jgi:hypothetical protein